VKNVLKEPFVRRGAVLLLAVVGLIFVASSDQLHSAVVAAIEWGRPWIEARSALGMLVFVVLAALSAMIAFFSSAIVVPLALSAWGPVVTVLLLWLGWFLGGLTSYFIGKYPGRKLLWWALPAKQTEQFERVFTQNARLPFVFLFQLALPSEIPGYVLGAMRYPLHLYLLVLAISEFPFVLGTVYLGDSFLQRDYAILAIIGVAGIILSSTTTYFLYKKMRLTQKSPE
jgi:uncharacterized membrane protein YdjX (TVP38/TMEM64 family)